MARTTCHLEIVVVIFSKIKNLHTDKTTSIVKFESFNQYDVTHLLGEVACPQTPAVLSISFEVGIPTGEVGGSLLFECQRRELPRGV